MRSDVRAGPAADTRVGVRPAAQATPDEEPAGRKRNGPFPRSPSGDAGASGAYGITLAARSRSNRSRNDPSVGW